MKNPLGLIQFVLLLLFVFGFISWGSSRDYLTTLTSETKPVEVPSSPSPESPKISTERVVENPDGTKTYFVDVSVNLELTAEISGQFFDSSKYEWFVVSTIIQERTFDLLKDMWDRYYELVALFVAMVSISIGLLTLITKKPPFLRKLSF